MACINMAYRCEARRSPLATRPSPPATHLWAYVGMAYTVMAYTFGAYIVMARSRGLRESDASDCVRVAAQRLVYLLACPDVPQTDGLVVTYIVMAHSYGLYSYDLCSYGLCSYGLCSGLVDENPLERAGI